MTRREAELINATFDGLGGYAGPITCSFLIAANQTRIVGSPTAGANGDVTSYTIPGSITLTFSGQRVRHADGRQLQRVGLIPDIRIAPTASDIAARHDVVLEAGLLDALRTAGASPSSAAAAVGAERAAEARDFTASLMATRARIALAASEAVVGKSFPNASDTRALPAGWLAGNPTSPQPPLKRTDRRVERRRRGRADRNWGRA